MPDKYLEAVWTLEQRGEKPTARDVAAATGMAYPTTTQKLTHHTRAGLVARKRKQHGKEYTYRLTGAGTLALREADDTWRLPMLPGADIACRCVADPVVADAAPVVSRWVRYDLREGVPEPRPWTVCALRNELRTSCEVCEDGPVLFASDAETWTHVDILEGMPPLLPPPDYEAERIAARVAELEAQLAAARAELADLRGGR